MARNEQKISTAVDFESYAPAWIPPPEAAAWWEASYPALSITGDDIFVALAKHPSARAAYWDFWRHDATPEDFQRLADRVGERIRRGANFRLAVRDEAIRLATIDED